MFLSPVFISQLTNLQAPHFISELAQQKALFYTLIYNSVILASLHFYIKLFGKTTFHFLNKVYRLKYDIPIINTHLFLVIFIILLYIASVLAKIYLNNQGQFSMVYNEIRGTFYIPFLQIWKQLVLVDLVMLLTLGYLIREMNEKNIAYKILFGLISVSLLYSTLLTGSRMQLLILFLAYLYIFNEFALKNKYFLLLFVFFAIPLFFIMGYYRTSYGTSLANSFAMYLANNSILPDIFDVMLGRLNYLDILSKVIENTTTTVHYGIHYLYNIVGLVPRIFWPEKPTIGLDMHEIGQALLIIPTSDTRSTAGLSIVGESFYELFWFGSLIAVFHGFLMYVIDYKIHARNLVGYVLYFLLSTYLVSKDGLYAVIPGMIHILMVYFPILVIIILILNQIALKPSSSFTKVQ